MRDMKIATKLFVGFGVAALLLIACAVTGMLALSHSAQDLAEVQAVDIVSSDVSSIVSYAASINDSIKAIALTDDAAERQKLLDSIGELRKAYKEKLDAVTKNTKTTEGKELLAKLQQRLAAGKAVNQKLLQAGMKGDRAAFIELYKNEGKFAFEGVRDAGKEINAYYEKLAAARTDSAAGDVKKGKLIVVAISAAALLIYALISALFSASITRPINGLIKIADRISEGDLTVAIDSRGKDETSALMRAMENMVTHMKQTIGALTNASIEISSSAGQLHGTSQGLVSGANEVVAQSQSVATAGEEMAATCSEIAKSCYMTAENADQANRAALEGAEVVKRSVAAMESIANRVTSAAKTVDSLGGRSEQIGEIVGTIEDIADQTNLLALNAAIEAARAGEQGRGFAVVADEVRALAERTTRATREIGEMIKRIQADTRAAVGAMDQGVSEVEKGTGEVAKSGQALEAILRQIGSVTQQTGQIATAVEEQSATTSEISHNMQRITDIVQDSARGAQETDGAANRLTILAEELQRNVQRFRLAV